jgi:hypothetical protein
VDLVELHAVALLQFGQQFVDGLYGEPLQPAQAAVALGVDDARDHVVAAADLLVVGAGRVHDLGGREIDEVDDHRRGPKVHGHAHAALAEGAGVDADQARRQVGAVDPVAHFQGDVDLPGGSAQVVTKAAQYRQLGTDLLDAVLLGERAPQPVEVVGVVEQRRRLYVHFEGAHGRVLPPIAGQRQRLRLGDGVAARLLASLARGRHGDGHVAVDQRLASQDEAGVGFGRREVGVRAQHDGAFSPHLAAPAAALTAARRLDLHAGVGGGVQDRGAGRNVGDGAVGAERHRRPGRLPGLCHARLISPGSLDRAEVTAAARRSSGRSGSRLPRADRR